jgi:hypothetical protein
MRLPFLLTSGGLLVLACNFSGIPDLCKDYPPVCNGNVAVNCISQQPCDMCSYERSFSNNDCDLIGTQTGVPKVCKIGIFPKFNGATCVDWPLTDCGGHQVGGNWCAANGHAVHCYQTTEGPLLSSDAVYSTCSGSASPGN